MSGGGNANALAEKSRASLRERFKAWWEGYDFAPRAAPLSQPAAAQAYGHAVRYERNRELWETSRVTLVQQVWGEGFTTPGGADHIMAMIKYFGLDPAMSVLDIGAALGGAGRLMSGKFGVWVSGLEADPQLVEAATALSAKAGLAKKAAVEQFRPDSFSYKAKSIDCAFSKEFFFTVQDKMAFLRAVESLLKPRGQLLFTDYVLAKPHLTSKALDQWKSCEPITPHPWAVEDYREVLGGLHLDIRVVEDITETHKRMVTKGWADYLATAKRGGIHDDLAPALVDEIELWTRRINAIEAGDLKVARIHALKKDTYHLMSDW